MLARRVVGWYKGQNGGDTRKSGTIFESGEWF